MSKSKITHIGGWNEISHDENFPDSFELQMEVEGGRVHLIVIDEFCTVDEAAFKLRQLAASIEREAVNNERKKAR